MPESRIEDLKERLEAAEKANHYVLQRYLCERLLEPDNPVTHLRHADALLPLGCISAAEREIARAREIAPGDTDELAYQALGRLERARGRHALAAEHFLAAYRTSQAGWQPEVEKRDDLILEAAQERFRAGDPEGCIELCSQAADGEFPKAALFRMSWALCALERYREAAETCRKILVLSPKHQGAQNRLEEIEAVQVMRRPSSPASAEALLSIISDARKEDQHLLVYEAVRQYRHGGHPLHRLAWIAAGTACEELARYDEGLEFFDRGLTGSEDAKVSWFGLTQKGHLLAARGDHSRALEVQLAASQLRPGHASAWIYAGGQATILEKHEQAQYYRQAAACADGCLDEALYNIGCRLLATKHYDEARLHFLDALAIDPGYQDARQRLEDVEAVLKEQAGEKWFAAIFTIWIV